MESKPSLYILIVMWMEIVNCTMQLTCIRTYLISHKLTLQLFFAVLTLLSSQRTAHTHKQTS